MKSFCIKSNNKKINTYLLNSLNKTSNHNLRVSQKKFKIYENTIVHYTGKDFNYFFDLLCNTLTNTIIEFYEKNELKKIITHNYFYFSEIEQSIILNDSIKFLNNSDNIENYTKQEHIYVSLLKYLDENKSIILDGFVNFRIKNYKKILEYAVDTCVNNFIIEKEYNEFIELLKIYINSTPSKCNILHLLYKNNESILMDENYSIISTKDFFLKANYLSDINFSSNDYTLNAILTLLPKRLRIHLIDNSDEFINTLRLIMEDNIEICCHCSLCTKYKLNNKP